MSRIKEIEINRQFVLNLGNYETARFGVSMTIEVAPEDDPDTEYDNLLDKIENRLQEDMDAFTN